MDKFIPKEVQASVVCFDVSLAKDIQLVMRSAAYDFMATELSNMVHSPKKPRCLTCDKKEQQRCVCSQVGTGEYDFYEVKKGESQQEAHEALKVIEDELRELCS